MVNNAVVSHNSVNELYYLEEVDSTNTWAKANLDKFGPVGASVYHQPDGGPRAARAHLDQCVRAGAVLHGSAEN